jgi:succinyl-CoA synthetase beta subunit
VDLYEFEAKHLFREHGVPVTPGEVVTTAVGAHEAARKIGTAVVVKAQVKTGGRGKAGGVKLATTPDEAQEKAEAILGLDIKGHIVRKILVTEATDIAEEYYVSFLLDRTNRAFLAMASVAGGVDIEEVAATRPDELARVRVDALEGVDLAKAKEIVAAAKFPAKVADAVADMLVKLWVVLVEEDAKLKDPNTTELEKWQIQSSRAIRQQAAQSNQALFQANDLFDKTQYMAKAAANPIFEKYKDKVEAKL